MLKLENKGNLLNSGKKGFFGPVSKFAAGGEKSVSGDESSEEMNKEEEEEVLKKMNKSILVRRKSKANNDFLSYMPYPKESLKDLGEVEKGIGRRVFG